MSATKSDFNKILTKYASLLGTVLYNSSDVLDHCQHLRKKLSEIDSKFFKISPNLLDGKQQLVSDVISI